MFGAVVEVFESINLVDEVWAHRLHLRRTVDKDFSDVPEDVVKVVVVVDQGLLLFFPVLGLGELQRFRIFDWLHELDGSVFVCCIA